MRFDRSEAMPKPVRVLSNDPRPVRIERTPSGVEFYSNVSGRRLTKEQAVAAMRAYKHGTAAVNAKLGSLTQPAARQPKARKARVEKPWIVAVYRTNLNTRKSVTLAEVQAETFLAAATKLASLCMQHVSDSTHAVEVRIEQAA